MTTLTIAQTLPSLVQLLLIPQTAARKLGSEIEVCDSVCPYLMICVDWHWRQFIAMPEVTEYDHLSPYHCYA